MRTHHDQCVLPWKHGDAAKNHLFANVCKDHGPRGLSAFYLDSTYTHSFAWLLMRLHSLPHVMSLAGLVLDWPGGQLTSSAVSAIDFGPLNRMAANQGKEMQRLMESLGGTFGANPGHWVRSDQIRSDRQPRESTISSLSARVY
jgi:hypothetical protein